MAWQTSSDVLCRYVRRSSYFSYFATLAFNFRWSCDFIVCSVYWVAYHSHNVDRRRKRNLYVSIHVFDASTALQDICVTLNVLFVSSSKWCALDSGHWSARQIERHGQMLAFKKSLSGERRERRATEGFGARVWLHHVKATMPCASDIQLLCSNI